MYKHNIQDSERRNNLNNCSVRSRRCGVKPTACFFYIATSLESHRQIRNSEFSTLILLHNACPKKSQLKIKGHKAVISKHFNKTTEGATNSADSLVLTPTTFLTGNFSNGAMFSMGPPSSLRGNKAGRPVYSTFLNDAQVSMPPSCSLQKWQGELAHYSH